MRRISEIPVRAMAGGLLVVLLNACDTPPEKTALPPPFASQREVAMAETAPSRAAAVLTFPQHAASQPRDLLPGSQPISSAAAPQAAPKSPSSGAPVQAQAIVAEAPLIEGPTPVAGAAQIDVRKTTSDAAATSTIPAAGMAIHLASYRAIDQAQRGWSILSASHPELVSLTPLYVPVDIPGKGHFLRLYGSGENPAKLAEICHGLQSAGAYCAVSIGR